MPLTPPNLDTRTFEDLVTEVRRRIPTLTPEWTDLNESDPGITLAQLFAFMSEQLLFQINQVPEKGLVTFLKMVGAELHPATPAQADVTLIPSAAGGGPKTFTLSAGTRVETSGPPPGQKTAIIFETNETFTVLNGTLVDLVSQDCNLNFVSHKTANDAAKDGFLPFQEARTTTDALFLVFDLNVTAPPGWPDGRFRIRVNLAGSTDVGEPDPNSFATDVPQRIEWSYSSGFIVNADGSESLTFTRFGDGKPTVDSTEEFTQSGYLQFEFDPPTANAFERAPDDDLIEPQFFRGFFVLQARLLRPEAYNDVGAPRLGSVRLNTIPASAVQTVTNEPVGASTGQPSQRFTLAHAPVIPGSTSAVVNEVSEAGPTNAIWEEVDDLFTRGPNDRVYQLLPATAEILFGDGVFGRIPPPDDGSSAGGNIRMESYRFGGAFASNVGAGTLTNVTLIDSSITTSFDATNVLPAAGGADEEPVARGVARAPAVVRSRFRAVSAEDFEALARETPSVRIDRALALPNTRPNRDAGTSPGSVTMVLVPFALFETSIQSPILTQPSTIAAVLRFLDQRRLVTTEVFARSAEFRQVTVEANIQTEARASVTETRSRAIDRLNRFFHALVGGSDGTGWPFGGTIFFSNVFEQLLDVAGVARVESLSISLDGAPGVECQDVPLRPGELLFSGQHIVRTQARGGA
jgi:predicted phage baseplate assembly protein